MIDVMLKLTRQAGCGGGAAGLLRSAPATVNFGTTCC
jgi:hypothetical protein